MLYELASRPPKAGSLREAIFLTVWLRRQEAKALEMRIMAQGLSDIVGSSKGGKTSVPEIFPKYLAALFPFMKQEQAGKDAEMKEMMQRQVAKGVLTFDPMSTSFIKKKAKEMSVPDEWAEKLRERAKEKK